MTGFENWFWSERIGGACVGPDEGKLIHEMIVAMAGRMTVQTFALIPNRATLPAVLGKDGMQQCKEVRGVQSLRQDLDGKHQHHRPESQIICPQYVRELTDLCSAG